MEELIELLRLYSALDDRGKKIVLNVAKIQHDYLLRNASVRPSEARGAILDDLSHNSAPNEEGGL